MIIPMLKKKNGFTLQEVLITIAIIGILSVGVTYSYGTLKKRSIDGKVQAKMGELQTLAVIYYDNTNTYAGFCGSGEASEVIDQAFSYTDSARTPDLPFYNDCKDDDDEWLAMAPLASAGNFCTDSTGDKFKTSRAFPLTLDPNPAHYVNNCKTVIPTMCPADIGFSDPITINMSASPCTDDTSTTGLSDFSCTISHSLYNWYTLPPFSMILPQVNTSTNPSCDVSSTESYINDVNNYSYQILSYDNQSEITSGGWSVPYDTVGTTNQRLGSVDPVVTFNGRLVSGASEQTIHINSCFIEPVSLNQRCHPYELHFMVTR